MSVARCREYVLTLPCPDKPGIVNVVSSFFVKHSGEHPVQPAVRRKRGRAGIHVGTFCVPARDAELAQDLQLAHAFSWAAEAFHMSQQPRDKAAWAGCRHLDTLTRNPSTKVRT